MLVLCYKKSMKELSGPEETCIKAFLASIKDEKMPFAEAESLAKELSGLARVLGLEVASQEIVSVRENHAKYGMGTGKAKALAEKAASLGVDCIIFDIDISPSRQRNWEELAGIPVIDRQGLIIQIFASRARTREAALQVSLAELVYALPRLRHKYLDLGRQRGGRYGTRGSGETRLETDRRRVEQQIHRLQEQLEKLKAQRGLQRKQREKSGVPVCALVGYTNAGKSSLLNALTGAGVLTEDKLFATLDSTSRRLKLPGGMQVLLVDTVGFIRRLPHSLVNAFRSTLEELCSADLLINVLDASESDTDAQYSTTLSVLRELNAGEIPMVTVLNKIDKTNYDKTSSIDKISSIDKASAIDKTNSIEALLKLYPGSLPVSAVNGTGLAELCMRIEKTLVQRKNLHHKGSFVHE